MSTLTSFDDEQTTFIVRLLGGFFGVVFAFLFLPKALKLVIKKFAVGLIGEILAIVTVGLLTEKLVDQVSHDDNHR